MTAREYLQDIRETDRKILAITYDIKEIQAQKDGLKSLELSERVKTSTTYTNQIDNLMEREKKLLNERQKLIDEWWNCRNLINCIKNKELVNVLSYYYLRGKYKRNINGTRVAMTWEDVAEKMCTSARQIYRLHGEALQQFRKISGMK